MFLILLLISTVSYAFKGIPWTVQPPLVSSFKLNVDELEKTEKVAPQKRFKLDPSLERFVVDFSKLDLRVGKVLECQVHPNDLDCFVTTMDLGEAEPRTIVSRVRDFIKQEQIFNQDKYAVVCCNTKPVTVKGITSHGNIMYAEDSLNYICVLYGPSRHCRPGDRICVSGIEFNPLEPSVEVNYAYFNVRDYLMVGEEFHTFFVHRRFDGGDGFGLTGMWKVGRGKVESEVQGIVRLATT